MELLKAEKFPLLVPVKGQIGAFGQSFGVEIDGMAILERSLDDVVGNEAQS